MRKSVGGRRSANDGKRKKGADEKRNNDVEKKKNAENAKKKNEKSEKKRKDANVRKSFGGLGSWRRGCEEKKKRDFEDLEKNKMSSYRLINSDLLLRK